LEEAAVYNNPKQLRRTFIVILLNAEVENPALLYQTFRKQMMDLNRFERKNGYVPEEDTVGIYFSVFTFSKIMKN